MNFKDSERPWLVAGALSAVVLTGAAWFTLIGPEFANASTVRSQIGDVQTQNSVLQSKTAKLRQQSEQLPELQSELTQKLNQLPTDAQFSGLTAQINQQAAEAGVTLSGLSFTTPTAVSGNATANAAGQTFAISLTIQAAGSLPALQKFLHQVQAVGPRAALVSSVSISQSASIYTLSATMNVFTTPLSQAQSDQLQSELTATAPGK